jgi:heptosyltransferase-2
MAPASVWFTKQLPEAKWVELIKKTPAWQAVFLVGGPGDHALCERIRQAINAPNVHNTAGKFSLLQTAALMKHAVMNYTNDSAPQHLASAMDAPVTVFFCSTTPNFGFGPLSTIAHTVEISEQLACRPCGLHGKKACPKGHFDCGRKIEL